MTRRTILHIFLKFEICSSSFRFFVGVYVRPGELDHVLHMIKPTLSLSPFGFFYVDMSVLPHKSFVRSQMQLTFNIKKELPFGSLQFNLYTKNLTLDPVDMPTTTTEQLRQQASLPFRLSKGVDVGAILASATLFEKRGEVRMFQGVEAKPAQVKSLSSLPSTPTILFIVPIVFAISYIFSAIFQACSRAGKVLLVCFIVGCLIVFFFFKY